MLWHWHVELERPNCIERAKQIALGAAAQSSHAREKRLAIRRPQVRRQLQLVLAKWSSTHVALEVLPSGLVVQRYSGEPRDFRKSRPLIGVGGGCRLALNVV